MSAFPDAEPKFERWLARAQKGDSDSLGRIFAHYRDELLRVARHKVTGQLQPKAEPADVVQDTFLEAQIAFRRCLALTEADMFHWLKRILQNNIADLNRRFHAGKRDVATEMQLNTSGLKRIVDEDPTPGTQAANRELAARMGAAIMHLPPEHREILRLREMEKMHFAEIAVQMNKPTADAARKHYDRAFAMLQQLLGGPDART